ncbi:hypothetical protein C8R44DRAFT_728499 [Mycena epipterygia]|nr:hypothetical protein C8R44DRAFT_728499 [Mycena epipterygia]
MAFGLAAPYDQSPLPPRFLFRMDRRITETMEWIHEYGTEQIHHAYPISFGFGGYDARRTAVFWKIEFGDTILARFEIPAFIFNERPFEITPELVFAGILHSLANDAPARVRPMFGIPGPPSSLRASDIPHNMGKISGYEGKDEDRGSTVAEYIICILTSYATRTIIVARCENKKKYKEQR